MDKIFLCLSPAIYVDSNSDYKANERPRQFELDDALYEIAAVEDQWYSPEAMFFKEDDGRQAVHLAPRRARGGMDAAEPL